jgi:NADH-quinone oxidoreductase subunit K
MLVLFIIAVAACEAAVALALVLMMFHRRGKLDIAQWRGLREANQPPFQEETSDDASEQPEPSPRLVLAGVAPEIPREETDYRPRV